ncbi:MAG: glucan biosynthesis protein G [Rhodocyclaceae bacterium]|nr:glucan biosynthesis protein G [Rhodocyclaceae bacterium]
MTTRRVGRVLALLLAVIATAPVAARAAAFGFDQVVAKARERAGQSYQAPAEVPEFMRKLSYDEFRSIRFDPQKSLWRDSGSKFEVMLMAPGLFFRAPVAINIIDSDGVQRLPFRKDVFQVDNPELARKLPADLGYAGFKLTFPINARGVSDQFLVFAGASYFRGVGKGDVFGLSSRGAAIDTGLMSGEEFPDFVEFWLERPSKSANAIRLYALLDSKRMTGAYQFSVYPGQPTQIDVKAELFTRKPIELLGVAPLTSMFFYGENTTRPQGEWRPEVHDSDGLLIFNGSGEWLWNPLMNPLGLNMQAFSVDNVRGFGLMQRDQAFASYHDTEAHYHRRPSAWVMPQGDWGKGRIVLVEIPTRDETNDNMVAFWSPPGPVAAGQRLAFDYRLVFGNQSVARERLARTVDSFVGRGDLIGGGNVAGAYRVVVDFAGPPLDALRANAPVNADVSAQEGGEVLEHFVTYIEAAKRWRLSILARPAEDKPLALRAALRLEGQTLTETWTYTLPSKNALTGEAR